MPWLCLISVTTRARASGVAPWISDAHRRGEEGSRVRLLDAQLVQAHHLALAHHHAAGKLGEIFAGADLGEQALHLAEPALPVQAPRIAGELGNAST